MKNPLTLTKAGFFNYKDKQGGKYIYKKKSIN